jgi:hypothetical protein
MLYPLEGTLLCIRSLSSLLALGYGFDESNAVFEQEIKRRLMSLRASKDPAILHLRRYSQRLSDEVDILKQLPLYISHYDVNKMNFHVDHSSGNFVGILDWELAIDMLLEFDLHSLHDIVGCIDQNGFNMSESLEQSERWFWEELLNNVPEDVQQALQVT